MHPKKTHYLETGSANRNLNRKKCNHLHKNNWFHQKILKILKFILVSLKGVQDIQTIGKLRFLFLVHLSFLQQFIQS